MVEARADLQDRVLDVVRELAAELGGDARRARGGARGLPRARRRPRQPRARRAAAAPRARLRPPLDDALPRASTRRRSWPARSSSRRRSAPVRRPAPAARASAAAPRSSGARHAPRGALAARAGRARARRRPTCARTTAASTTLTYGRLLREAARRRRRPARARRRRGDTVALMLPTGFDFLRCFQGILIARRGPGPDLPAGCGSTASRSTRSASPRSWPTRRSRC